MTLTRCILSVAAAALFALSPAQAGGLSKVDYHAAKGRINATYGSEKLACSKLSGNGRDICVEEAKAREKVAYAELEFSYTATAADQNKLWVAKAESSHAVAKARCEDKSGKAKGACRQEAKAAEVKALADAKLGRQVSAAQPDAAANERDADRQAALQKCETLAGDPKATCVAAAKAR